MIIEGPRTACPGHPEVMSDELFVWFMTTTLYRDYNKHTDSIYDVFGTMERLSLI